MPSIIQRHDQWYNYFWLKQLTARVAQWLECRVQRSIDPYVGGGGRIPLWDVGAGLSDETV
jgi:hypothetical protein